MMWFGIKQNLPCNNNGNAALGVCGTPTTLPNGISKDSSNMAYRLTFTKNY